MRADSSFSGSWRNSRLPPHSLNTFARRRPRAWCFVWICWYVAYINDRLRSTNWFAEYLSRLSYQREQRLWNRARTRKQCSAAWICRTSHHQNRWESTRTNCPWCDRSTCDLLLPEKGEGVQVRSVNPDAAEAPSKHKKSMIWCRDAYGMCLI
jgi:hypothetical protein